MKCKSCGRRTFPSVYPVTLAVQNKFKKLKLVVVCPHCGSLMFFKGGRKK